jgi:hypothetical protein
VNLAGQYLEECAFSRAVLPDEGYAVFLVDNKRDALEKRACSKFHG